MRIVPKSGSFIKNLNSNVKCFLFYGGSLGHIKEYSDSLINHLLGDKGLSDRIYNVDYNDFKNSSHYTSLLFTPNLLGERIIIKVNNIENAVAKDLKELMSDEKLYNYLILLGDLPKSSSLRATFEKENHLYAIACYGEENIMLFIREIFTKESFIVNREVLEFLGQVLAGKDILVIRSEINKLITYNYHKKTIEIDDIEKILSDNIEFSPDELCKYFLINSKKYFQELDNLLKGGVSPISILRALGRYFGNLYIVKLKLNQHMLFDEAIKILKPPIFYKNIPGFKAHLNKLSIEEINSVSQEIMNIEAKCKQGIINPKSLLNDLYFHKL